MWSIGASALLLALAPFSSHVAAQSATPVAYTDPDTGIIFDTWTGRGMTFGLSLPADALTTDADEFIGILQCTGASEGEGWCGLSMGGSMNNNLLIFAYPHDGKVLTAFMWSTGYEHPVPYTGEAELTQISSSIDADGFELIYRCVGCLAWSQGGSSGSLKTSSGGGVMGWAVNAESPGSPACPQEVELTQHDDQSIFGATLTENAANEEYDDWAALATNVVPGECDGTPPPETTTTSIPAPTGVPVPTGTVYDYVVIGGGAGGIPTADRLSEDGSKVLLIEKGPPSTGQWGGQKKPEWLEGTDLTRFDVPGLCNQIWADSAGIACRDTDQMAGCLLGGGTAINAGLWWKPSDADWDYNFPEGWKSSDMHAAVDRVWNRIPGTTRPSQDGELYLSQGYDIVSGGLKAAGWNQVDVYADPNSKRKAYTETPYMFEGGERGGPLATYLASASARDNFDMWTNTQATRLVREGGHATAVEVEPYAGEGYVGTVQLTPGTGRVVVSSGTFGSAKFLLRSGIGPQDQLEVVAESTDGPTMVAQEDWILLPVGHNLEDHTNTDTVVSHPDVVFYDFYEAYDDPIVADRDAYLNGRTGILAQAAPNIGPVFFDEIDGADGVTRSLQWTSRVEASLGHNDTHAITMSQYLGRGAKSRGRMTINTGLSTVVSDVPYLKNEEDVEAVISGIENLREALSGVEGLTWLSPPADMSARDYVNDYLISTSTRRANHWIGSNKMGPNDGRQENGDAVVDLNTKVWGTDNVFVVDASIFPGMVTTNPSAYIVSVAEHAAEKILNLGTSMAGALHSQCGGQTWNGTHHCAEGLTCTRKDAFYSQCL